VEETLFRSDDLVQRLLLETVGSGLSQGGVARGSAPLNDRDRGAWGNGRSISIRTAKRDSLPIGSVVEVGVGGAS